MTVILPIIAILSVTGEWSQRSGLTTFTLVPHRGRVITAKAISCVAVAVVTIPLAFGIGALGNVVGTAIAGVDPVWDVTATNLLLVVLANVLGMLVGFMLGVVIRTSAGAIVAYFVYSFLLPTLALLLATSQEWFRDLQPWVDFHHAQGPLLEGALTAQQWSHLGVTGLIWLVIPLTVGLWFVLQRKSSSSSNSLHGQDGDAPDDGADGSYGVQHAVAAAADRQDGRSDRRCDGSGKSGGDVEHAEVLGGVVPVRQYVDDEREVDGDIHAEAESADGHTDEETVEVTGDGNHEHPHAEHDRRGEDEDLPSARPVRQPAADEGTGDNDDGLDKRAEEYLLRHVGLGAADLVQQVIGLVSEQESVGQDEHEATGEGPGEVSALPRIDVERARELPKRPGRPVRPGKPAVVERAREEQDEEPADRARCQEHGELVAGEQRDKEGAAHRRDRQTDTQDTGDHAALSDRDLVR